MSLRLAVIGAGWIVPYHLAALDRLGRTRLVGVASAHLDRAESIAAPRAARGYDDLTHLLDEQQPDVALVAVPPAASPAICEQLVERGIPFLVEKPLAATDDEGPERVAAAIAARPLVVAVGYHLRALEQLPEIRDRMAADPPILVTAQWRDGTPAPAWWLREVTGGGQVVEQATHLYDLARHLVGEATVVGAVSSRSDPPVPEGADIVDATAAVLRFDAGAVGTFANTRRQATHTVEISFTSDGPRTTIRRTTAHPGRWEVTLEDGTAPLTLPPGRDPYERQLEAFLDAVEADDPAAVLATYADALGTYRLTRAVIAATGRAG